MSRLLPDDQVSEAYRRTRQSVLELLTQIPESSAAVRVPACPDWTLQQTVSHFVGVPEDLLAGRMEGVASDAWTNAQVRHHEGESLAELATALEATIIPFDAILPAIPRPSNSQLVMDAVTHEIDLREALGLPCVDSSPSLTVARAWLLGMIERHDSLLGDQLEAVSCSDFILVRALTGRFSISAMDAHGLPGAQIAAALAGTPLTPPA